MAGFYFFFQPDLYRVRRLEKIPYTDLGKNSVGELHQYLHG